MSVKIPEMELISYTFKKKKKRKGRSHNRKNVTAFYGEIDGQFGS